jgi:hypothetical protein
MVHKEILGVIMKKREATFVGGSLCDTRVYSCEEDVGDDHSHSYHSFVRDVAKRSSLVSFSPLHLHLYFVSLV